jgi:hypothetical protein
MGPSSASFAPSTAGQKVAITSRLTQTYRAAQPYAANGWVSVAPRIGHATELVSVGSGGAAYHLHPSSDGDGTWVADNLGCPKPVTQIVAAGNPDGTLTFYALVQWGPSAALMFMPEGGAWAMLPGIPDSQLADHIMQPLELQVAYDARLNPYLTVLARHAQMQAKGLSQLQPGNVWAHVVDAQWDAACWTPGQSAVDQRPGCFAQIAYMGEDGSELPSRFFFDDETGSQELLAGESLLPFDALSATRAGKGLSNLFALRTSDKAVYWMPWTADDWTTPPTAITGAVKVASMAATSTIDGVMSLFAADQGGALYHVGQHAQTPGQWQACVEINKDLGVRTVIGASPLGDSPEVFVTTNSGGLVRVWSEDGGMGWHFDPIEIGVATALEEIAAYNVQVTLYDANDVAMANAPVTVRCAEDVILEVNSVSTFFGSGNSWTGTANALGQVILSVPATSLGVPKVTLITANGSQEVDPSGPVRSRLATLDETQLRQAQVTQDDGTQTPLVPPNLDPAALASLLQGVTAAATSVPLNESGTGQPPQSALFHRLHDPRTVVPRALAVDAAGAAPSAAGAASSWTFEFKKGAPRFRTLTAPERMSLRAEHDALPPLAAVLGWDVSWGDVFDAVTSGIVKLVSATVDTVGSAVSAVITVVVDGVTRVFNAAVTLAEQALDMVQEMFKTVVDGFDQLFRWLGHIFDWGDIKRTKQVMVNVFGQMIDYASSVLNDLQSSVDGAFVDYKKKLHDAMAAYAASLAPSMSIGGARTMQPVPVESERQLDDASATNIVQQSMLNHMGGITLGAPPSTATALALTGDNPLADFINHLQAIGAQSQSSDAFKNAVAYFAAIKDHPEQFLQLAFAGLIEMIDALVQLALDAVQGIVDLFFAAVRYALASVKEHLGRAWNIPVVSPLYAKYFESELTTLDLMALVVAVPSTALYKVLFKAPPFPDDAAVARASALYTRANLQRMSGWPKALGGVVAAVAATDDPPPNDYVVCKKLFQVASGINRLVFTIPDTLLDVTAKSKDLARLQVLNEWALASSTIGWVISSPYYDGESIPPWCNNADQFERMVWLLAIVPVGVDWYFYIHELQAQRPGAIARNLGVAGITATAVCGVAGLALSAAWVHMSAGQAKLAEAAAILDAIPGALKWLPPVLGETPYYGIAVAGLGVLDVGAGVAVSVLTFVDAGVN